MKVYVDWHEEEVISQEQYDERVAARAADYVDDDSLLDTYLENRYTSLALFTMSEEERAEVRGDFAEWCHREAESNLSEDFDEYEV
jgi:hypothetical protein